MLQALEILMVTTIVGQIPAPCMFPIQFESKYASTAVALGWAYAVEATAC